MLFFKAVGETEWDFWLVALLFGFCNILSIPVRYVFPFPGLTTLDEIEVKVQLSAHDWEPWVRMAPSLDVINTNCHPIKIL